MALHYSCLPFHNQRHPKYVAEDTDRMTSHLDLSLLTQETGHGAALIHDLVQLKPRGVMERESAEWFERRLLRRFPRPAIVAGALAILGTEPTFDTNGKLVGQKATELEYPSYEAEQMALSVASADVGGELFRPSGPYRGHMLYKELQAVYDPAKAPSLEGFTKYQLGQVELVSGYVFPHPEGEVVLGALRGVVLRYHEQLATALQAGTVDTWKQVLDYDLAFQQEHSR